MENKIQIFSNPEFGEIRTVDTADGTLFCLGDVCRVLDLIPHKVAHRLGDDQLSRFPIFDSLGRVQQANFVNEDGMYDAILDSRKPEAKKFRKWITSDVIPSIRKHGAYMTDTAVLKAITEPDFLIQLANTLKEEKTKRILAEQACEEQKVQIENLNKKVSYLDLILASDSTVAVTQIAQDYGMSATKFNKILNNMNVQYKVGTQWVLYAAYKDKGYVASETIYFEGKDGRKHTTPNTRWTQKGRLFLYELLKGVCIYPTIEADRLSELEGKGEHLDVAKEYDSVFNTTPVKGIICNYKK